jgi:acetyl-CoA C-acetyltransferase
MLAAQGIALGDIAIAVAGGMESMSNAPYLLPRAREGLRMGNATLVDSMIQDGLWCAFEHCHMGMSGEHVAETYGVSREAQDEYAAESHQKAARAAAEGRFTQEIVGVSVPQSKGAPIAVEADESIRSDSTVDVLRRLKPAFKSDGSITAGNAPGVNDGAAAVVVMSEDRAAALGLTPLARIAGYATSGLAPKMLLMTPVGSIRKLLTRTGWRLQDVDLFEINEAFAAQMVAIINELGVDPARVNVNGGAIALGHPIGASGARVLTTLLHAMRARGAKKGIASLCLGGGNGVALAVEM